MTLSLGAVPIATVSKSKKYRLSVPKTLLNVYQFAADAFNATTDASSETMMRPAALPELTGLEPATPA